MINAVRQGFRVPELRKKLLFTGGVIILARLLSHVVVPGTDKTSLDALFSSSGVLGFLDLFSGGGLSRFSIIAMGVNPYINASIIMQLLTVVSDRFKEMSKDGAQGQRKINQYTRRLTVLLALVQSYGLIILFSNPSVHVLNSPTLFTTLTVMATLTCGTIFLMWLGEQITEYGIGNGISIIIFAGIVGRFLPSTTSSLGTNQTGGVLIFGVLAIGVVALIVYVQQGERRIRIQSAQRIVGRTTYQGKSSVLPLKVNQAGVIPIIFAISMMILPTMFANYFTGHAGTLGNLAAGITKYWQPTGPNPMWDIIYNSTYFIVIIAFTYFYTAITFDPVDVADNLKKQAIFITGVRPGKSTALYLDHIMTRITLVGGIFLASITVLIPLVAGVLAFGQAGAKSSSLYLGGTAVLIVVGVALDTMKQLETQLLMRNYKGFLS